MLRELKQLLNKLLRKRGPAEPPREPYAPVGAPKKPRRPQQSGAVALAEPDEE
jgi:hypothetical protein